MAELEPVSQPAGQAQRPTGRQANIHECPSCGGPFRVADGKPFPPHNQFVMTTNGPQEGKTLCDGHKHTTQTSTAE